MPLHLQVIILNLGVNFYFYISCLHHPFECAGPASGTNADWMHMFHY